MFKKKTSRLLAEGILPFLLFAGFFVFILFSLVSAAPTGPDSVTVQSNETKGAVSAYELNVSGGYISTINISSTTQNVRWKGMVGQVTGSFTLDDSVGSTLFDWSITEVAGEVYATRNSTSPTWTNIQCANVTLMETENVLINHTSADDNLTATFNTTSGASHSQFVVGTTTISANTCPTLNTYVNNVTQDSSFEEMALTDSTDFSSGGSIIYASILEQDANGFDNQTYDFQMIVPENGEATFTGSTAYYLYVELS